MVFIKDIPFGARISIAGAMMLFLGISFAPAQTRQILHWQKSLNALQKADDEELLRNREAVERIRMGVEFWVKLHPGSKAALPPAPQPPWGAEDIRNQVALLSGAVLTLLAEDPERPFDLGAILIDVTAEASPLSPVADSLGRREIADRQATTAAAALDDLPGVAADRISAGRNEAAVRIRGFSSKGQVAFYIDGIPVTMPYDGTIDFNRFLSSDIGEIQVSKGISSPLLGSNGMGGSVNLVTRQPEKRFQAEAQLGTGSGDRVLSSLSLGSRWRRLYVQGSVDWLQSDFVPLSGDFPLNDLQPSYKRNNSDSRDAKYTGRFAWTPRNQDQYVFSYNAQRAEKGVPLYAGPNSKAVFNRYSYRRWPYWDKTGYYLITNTGLGESHSIRFRAYYDQFQNEMDFFDDATYSSMNRNTSNKSLYDDHSAGGSAEFTTRAAPRHTIGVSFVFRDDNHKETLTYPARSPFPFTTPTLLDRAQQFSFGLQDVFVLSENLRATVGFSADHLRGLQVQKLDGTETALIPVACAASPENTSFSGCTARVWTYNPQATLSYSATPLDTLFVTFADRGRFPLMKESYSYTLGKGIPNPDLQPEHNTAWNMGYTRMFPSGTTVRVEYFHNRLRDAIQSVYVTDAAGLCSNTGAYAGYCSQNVNVAREVHQGAEISIRSTSIPRLILDLSYSYLNRTMTYNFGDRVEVNRVLTTVQILPTYPKNKVLAHATLRLPRGMLAMAGFRYEGGITLQDTTYRTAPENLPFAASHGTADLGAVVPIRAGLSLQAGVNNLFDRDYYYTAGFPEAGRNWSFNLRYRF